MNVVKTSGHDVPAHQQFDREPRRRPKPSLVNTGIEIQIAGAIPATQRKIHLPRELRIGSLLGRLLVCRALSSPELDPLPSDASPTRARRLFLGRTPTFGPLAGQHNVEPTDHDHAG